eukprot:6885209-Pyramimonas_sp.AAC.1
MSADAIAKQGESAIHSHLGDCIVDSPISPSSIGEPDQAEEGSWHVLPGARRDAGRRLRGQAGGAHGVHR